MQRIWAPFENRRKSERVSPYIWGAMGDPCQGAPIRCPSPRVPDNAPRHKGAHVLARVTIAKVLQPDPYCYKLFQFKGQSAPLPLTPTARRYNWGRPEAG